MLKKIFIILILLSLTACNTLLIQKETYKSTQQQVVLGSIGNVTSNGISQNYLNKAIPKYSEGIILSMQVVPFTKQSYKAYAKASSRQGVTPSFKYIDSLKPQKEFVILQIADQEKLLSQLHHSDNASILQWLQQNKKAKVLSAVNLYINNKQLKQLQQAETVLLETQDYKSNVLKLYKKGRLLQSISFAETTPFAYKLAEFCWGKNSKNKWVLSGLVKNNKSCPSQQFKSYKKATKPKELIDY